MPVPNYFTPKRPAIDLSQIADGMTRSEILSAIDQGARFLVFQYVLSFILITQQFNSKTIFLRPGERPSPLASSELWRQTEVSAKQFSDAVVAAIALEYGATIHTNDRDFARFPGLRWHNPLQG